MLGPLPTSLNGARYLSEKFRRKRGLAEEYFIVWFFGSSSHPYRYNLADLLTLPGLEPVTKLADGIILQIGGDDANDVMDLYRTEYLHIVNTPPTIRSSFDIRLHNDYLIYIKTPCTRADVMAPFFLHITPRSRDDLPVQRQRWSFDNPDFDFYKSDGILFDGKCLVTVPTPAYDMAFLSTSQHNNEERLWEATLSLDGVE